MDTFKRVLFINSLYYPENKGGAQNSVQIIAETLYQMGYEVYVLCNNGYNKMYTHNGVEVISTDKILNYSYSERYNKNALEKGLWHLQDNTGLFDKNKVKSIIQEIGPDIINTNIIAGFSVGLISLIEKLGVRHVHTVRDYYLLCLYANMYKEGLCNNQCIECKIATALKRKHIKNIENYIFISGSLKGIHKKYIDVERSTVIHNPIINSRYSKNELSKKKTDYLSIGYIGRLHPTKGVEVLLDAVSKITRQVKLYIAGEGNPKYMESIFSILDSNEVDYEYLGFVEPKRFYNLIDVNVVPSLWEEPFGRVVIESLQYKTPVILSDLRSFKEFVLEKDGIFFRRGNGMDLLDKLENFEPNGEVSKIDYKYYINKFSPEQIANQYLECFNEL